MTRPRTLLTVLLTALAVVSWVLVNHHHRPSPAGAAPTHPPAAPSTPPAPSPSSPAPSPSSRTTTGSLVTGAQDDDGASATTPAHANQQDLTTARAFLTAFARPGTTTTTAQWWHRVRPYFTAQAAADFAGTDPRQVPFTRVTGSPTLTHGLADGPTTTVTVPTDAGPYQVELLADVSGAAVHVASCEPVR